MNDVEMITQRIRARALEQPLVFADRVETLSASLDERGLWPDIDYDQEMVGWYWEPIQHLERLCLMVRARQSSDHSLSGDPMLEDRVLVGYDGWCQVSDRGTTSGGHVESVRIPRALGEVMVLMASRLSDTQRNDGFEYLRRAWTGKWGWTGENLVWRARNTMLYALLKPDLDLLDEVITRVCTEAIAVSDRDKDGIQQDMSFHQHGDQLYNGGYGVAFTKDCAELAGLLQGTRFAVPDEKVDLLSRLVLDGSQWMVRGQVFDYTATGRFFTRPTGHTMATQMIDVCHAMKEAAPSRAAAFDSFAQRVTGDESALEGNRHFWCSDFMVHHRQDYYASVRMYSTRTFGHERCTGEGGKSYHLPDGLTLVLRDGKEYGDEARSVFPVWDWRRLPGVTCEQAEGPLPTEVCPRRYRLYRGNSNFVGGVSDGRYGVAGYDFLKYVDPDDVLDPNGSSTAAVTARKGWFFFDDAFVCLGSAIQGFRDNRVVTTVNQCLLKGSVEVCCGDGCVKMLDPGFDGVISDVHWVAHDGIGYVFPDGCDVGLDTRLRKGRISEITDEMHGHVGDERGEEICCLYIDHGVRPVDAAYAYLVVPGASFEDLETYRLDSPISLNTKDIQSASQAGIGVSGAVFYAPGTVTLGDGLTLSVDQPCIAMVRKQVQGADVSISNPIGTALTVEVHLNDIGMTFDLPGGRDGGRSVLKKFEL